MSSGSPSKDIRQDPRIQSYPSANNNHNNIERQTSMSVGYLTRTQYSRDRPPYDINSNFIYAPQAPMQPSNNMPQHQPQPQQSPQQHRGSYDRPPSAHSRHASSIQSTSSSASSHSTAQQTPRITLPPLSAITENQDAQTEGGAPAAQKSQNVATSSQHPPPQIQQQQQPQQGQQQQTQTQQPQQQPQPSPSYPQRPPVQYESQQLSFPPSQRHLQPSQQLSSDQSRYQSGPAPQQMPLQPHQMAVVQLQPNPQIGQFPSPSPTPTHFPPQSQYAYPQPQYPPQSMYGQYPPHQMPPGMPPGIPYQPAYATSHRQRPPQFTPYPPPPSGFAPPPQGGPPQGWPPQDYIAQPLTPLTGHSPQQQYSPQLQQMSGPGGPMRIRRTSSALSQQTYPPQQGEPQPPSQPQSTLKPKRKRATSGQLRILNNVFASTFFPSTELRIALGKELNMSPRTVQIWFQNKRQSWRATKAKSEPGSGPTQQHHSGGTPSSQTFPASGSFSPHPLRQEQHFASSPSHARMPSSAEESGREEGMENDEGGGWEALRRAQQENRDYRPGASSGEGDDDGFEDEGINSPHHRHR